VKTSPYPGPAAAARERPRRALPALRHAQATCPPAVTTVTPARLTTRARRAGSAADTSSPLAAHVAAAAAAPAECESGNEEGGGSGAAAAPGRALLSASLDSQQSSGSGSASVQRCARPLQGDSSRACQVLCLSTRARAGAAAAAGGTEAPLPSSVSVSGAEARTRPSPAPKSVQGADAGGRAAQAQLLGGVGVGGRRPGGDRPLRPERQVGRVGRQRRRRRRRALAAAPAAGARAAAAARRRRRAAGPPRARAGCAPRGRPQPAHPSCADTHQAPGRSRARVPGGQRTFARHRAHRALARADSRCRRPVHAVAPAAAERRAAARRQGREAQGGPAQGPRGRPARQAAGRAGALGRRRRAWPAVHAVRHAGPRPAPGPRRPAPLRLSDALGSAAHRAVPCSWCILRAAPHLVPVRAVACAAQGAPSTHAEEPTGSAWQCRARGCWSGSRLSACAAGILSQGWQWGQRMGEA